MDCPHKNLRFNHSFAVGPHERMYQIKGICSDCGAPMEFQPRPTLTTDSKELQIPFKMGAPDLANLMPKPRPHGDVMRIGGPRKGMN